MNSFVLDLIVDCVEVDIRIIVVFRVVLRTVGRSVFTVGKSDQCHGLEFRRNRSVFVHHIQSFIVGIIKCRSVIHCKSVNEILKIRHVGIGQITDGSRF